jgi:hypothetical protein
VFFAENCDAIGRDLLCRNYPAPDGIVYIVIDIGNPVSYFNDLSLQGGRLHRAGVVQNPVPHFPCQVKASAPFQVINHPEALFVMLKSGLKNLVQRCFAGMPKWCVAEVMAQGYRFGKVLIKPQRPGYRPGNLCDFHSVSEPGAVMISLRDNKHLCLMFEAAVAFGVNNPVPVTLESSAHTAFLFRFKPAAAAAAQTGAG